MVPNISFYPFLPFEIRNYYEKVSKGLIEERPYDYWGPDTAEEEAHWQRWWLPIKQSFRPIDWDAGSTAHDIVEHGRKAMESPDLVGPMGEILVMDVDPLSDTIMWRFDNCSSSEAELGKEVMKQRSSSFEAAGKMYKLAKKHLVAFIKARRTKTSFMKMSPNFTKWKASKNTVRKMNGKIFP
ncbi:MAG: hypothetical protein ASARMPRED_002699 [Alectoria sarmentosa]|nr:MAG: hypothetical protein ASARMPRED_002699 [Alectoria sarmentosa]